MLVAKTSFANVAASQTDANVISAKDSTIFRIIGGWVICAGTATNVTFNSKGTGAGTAITSICPYGVNGGHIMPSPSQPITGEAPPGYFDTNKGEGLTVTTGAGASITGITIRYVEIK